FENIFSAFNDNVLTEMLSFLPDAAIEILVPILGLFVGGGWHLTLGLLFVVVIIFLPGGLMEGIKKMAGLLRKSDPQLRDRVTPQDQPGDRG
ncbi:MAG: hypothetical protein JKY12_03015, partial [Sneathiella sp.]|nr:hypothetical protein [Sneathiella sp.]